MKRISLFATISLAALLAACGGSPDAPSSSSSASSASSASYDRCTTMVTDWNSVVNAADSYNNEVRNYSSSASSRRAALGRAKAACDKFWNDNFGVGPCEVRSGQTETQKSAEDMRPMCDDVFALARENNVT